MNDDAIVSSADDDDELEDDSPLVDENAFGVWISWYDAEEVEYSQSADKFPPRIIVFRSAVSEYLESFPLGDGVTALDLGTAVYVEIADGDQSEELISWVKSFRAYLAQGDWTTFVVVTHGGRWVARDPQICLRPQVGTVRVLASFGPSDALRKAMTAEAMAHDDEETGDVGWGSGLFVDAEVFEALGRKLKNDPTALRRGGACFYRIGR